jgi:hypothetical protein
MVDFFITWRPPPGPAKENKGSHTVSHLKTKVLLLGTAEGPLKTKVLTIAVI